MDRGAISAIYAKALFRYANQHKQADSVYASTVALIHSYEKYPNLKRVLSNVILLPEKKLEIISLCVGNDMCDIFGRFVHLVLHQHREEFLQLICMNYRQLMCEHENLMDIYVTTAVPVNERTQKLMLKRLGEITGKKVIMQPVIDPEIIGGYILRWGTYRIDRSVTGTLKHIEKSLINELVES